MGGGGTGRGRHLVRQIIKVGARVWGGGCAGGSYIVKK